MLDIIEALKWIKNNIADLGGDEKISPLLRQSSGGDAIAHLMISEGVEDLFQHLIIQSAPLGLRHKKDKNVCRISEKTEVLKEETDVLKMMDEYKAFVPSVIKYGF